MKTLHESEVPLLDRDDFRERVLARDRHRCVHCGRTDRPLDAHHLMERALFRHGGYHLDNGVSVCSHPQDGCHLKAEQTLITPEQLREDAGLTVRVLPDALYGDLEYTKWGDVVHPGGTRSPGPRFWDASTQKALTDGGVLPRYDTRVKYPRTWHLPGSPGMQQDDRQLSGTGHWAGERLICTVKLDGGNFSVADDFLHGRSLSGRHHPSQNVLRALQPTLNLGPGVRLVAENLFAAHTLRYAGLAHTVYGLSFWEADTAWSWDDTVAALEVLGLPHPPLLYDGPYQGLDHLQHLAQQSVQRGHEGLVVRVARPFTLLEFGTALGKWVGQDFARHRDAGGHDWHRQPVTRNQVGTGPVTMTWKNDLRGAP